MLLLLLTAAVAADWPSIDEPLKTGASAPSDAALVVGIEDYYELPGVPYAAADAKAFRDFLVYTRGISPSRIELLNETKTTSASKIRAAAQRLGDHVKAGGTAWVYFAGHGAASPRTRERLLMGVTTSPDAEVFEEGTVPVTEIEQLAGAGGGKVFLVLDTCYAGAGVADLKRFAVPAYAPSGAPNVATWTAAGPNELSGPIEAAGHGAFTYFAIGALRGWADGVFGAPDGQVTAKEAQEYVAEALRAVQVRDQAPVLTGQRLGDWAVGLGVERGPDLSALNVRRAQHRTEGGVGSDDDIVGDINVITAQLRAAEELKRQLAAQREAALNAAASSMKAQASDTWSKLEELRSLGGEAAREKVAAFVDRYGRAEVTYDDAEGQHARIVEVPEVDKAKRWLVGAGRSPSSSTALEPETILYRVTPLGGWLSPDAVWTTFEEEIVPILSTCLDKALKKDSELTIPIKLDFLLEMNGRLHETSHAVHCMDARSPYRSKLESMSKEAGLVLYNCLNIKPTGRLCKARFPKLEPHQESYDSWRRSLRERAPGNGPQTTGPDVRYLRVEFRVFLTAEGIRAWPPDATDTKPRNY